MANIIVSIDNAADRHMKAQVGGQNSASKSKINREQIYQLLDQGKTHTAVATILGCSNKTIQRAVKERQGGQDKTRSCPVETTFQF